MFKDKIKEFNFDRRKEDERKNKTQSWKGKKIKWKNIRENVDRMKNAADILEKESREYTDYI